MPEAPPPFSLHTIKCMTLEHIPTDVRGESDDQKLLQLESHWIHPVKATGYPGLTEMLSFKPFL